MTWAVPWAWGLALAALLPVVAHLWSRRRPTSQPFPTLRFLRAASPVSRHLRSINDWPLLLLRVVIVAAICAAAAGPTLVSSWRQNAWHARLHRVVVVEDSVSVRAAGLVADEQRGVTSFAVFEGAPVPELLDDAIADASRQAQRMRTELVVLWDGSRASLTPADLGDVPRAIGIRLVRVDRGPEPRASAAGTGTGALPVAIHAGSEDQVRSDRLLAMLPRLPATAGGWSLEVRWAGSPDPPQRPTGPASPELRRVLDEVAVDPRVREAAERSARDRRAITAGAGPPVGRWLARSRRGTTLLRGWTDGNRLVLALDAEPTSPLAWWSVVSALESLARPWALVGTDVRWSDSELARARRAPALPPTSPLPGGLDTRAAWTIALSLLLVEQWRRRRGPSRPAAEVADAV